MNYDQLFYDAFYDRLYFRHEFSEAQNHRLSGFALAQAKFESADFTSSVFLHNSNPIGYKYYSGSKWQVGSGTGSPEGDTYAKYPDVMAAACELADWICRRLPDFRNVTTVEGYVKALKDNGYFGDNINTYTAGVAGYYEPIGSGSWSEDEPSFLESVKGRLSLIPLWAMLLFVFIFFMASKKNRSSVKRIFN